MLSHVDPAKIALEDAGVDLCHSGGTLEHYKPAELESFAQECFRILGPGGIASHVFDNRDHLYHADKRYPFLNHLRYSDTGYAFLFGHSLTYHNRLLPAEVVQIFEKAGFEKLLIRRRMLPIESYLDDDRVPDGVLQGLDRSKLAPRFRAATDSDLHSVAVHYFFRKPK